MEDRFAEPLVQSYIAGVLAKGTLVQELQRVQDLMVDYVKHPNPDKALQRALVGRANQLFRALLEAKAAYSTQNSR